MHTIMGRLIAIVRAVQELYIDNVCVCVCQFACAAYGAACACSLNRVGLDAVAAAAKRCYRGACIA